MYNPANWYWIVAGSTTQVWASGRNEYVPITDATYTAWLASGNVATRISTAASLAGVLIQQWLPLYMQQGVTLVSAGTPALNATYAADPATLGNITALSTGLSAGLVPGGGTTFSYPDITGAEHTFTSTNFLNFAKAMETLEYTIEQAIGALVSGVTATVPSLSLSIA